MTLRQTLILRMIAQIALLIFVGWVAFSVYQSPHIWAAPKLALVGICAFQVMMTLKAGRAVWRVL